MVYLKLGLRATLNRKQIKQDPFYSEQSINNQ